MTCSPAGAEAARDLGLRMHCCRGSLERGAPAAGLAPDGVLASADEILAATQRDITRFHDPAPDSMLRVAVAPATPLAVTPDLLRESAALARRAGVRLHTHLAESADEDAACQAAFGLAARPSTWSRRDGSARTCGWRTACTWTPPASACWAAPGPGWHTAPARTPGSGRVSRRCRNCWPAAPRSAWAPTGPPTSTAALARSCARPCWPPGPAAGPAALTARQALAMATMGSARCLGRQDEIGSLEVGKQADVVLWRLDGLGHADIADPVCALVFGPPAPVHLLTVAGRAVVSGGELRTADPAALAREARAARPGSCCAAPPRDRLPCQARRRAAGGPPVPGRAVPSRRAR